QARLPLPPPSRRAPRSRPAISQRLASIVATPLGSKPGPRARSAVTSAARSVGNIARPPPPPPPQAGEGMRRASGRRNLPLPLDQELLDLGGRPGGVEGPVARPGAIPD